MATLRVDVPVPRTSGDEDPFVTTILDQHFRDLRLLKSGSSVETYLGADRETGREVVVKAARQASLSHGAQMRLEHEAGVLERLGGAGLTPLLRYGSERGLLYLVTPFVAGDPLDRRLRRGMLPIPSVLAVARDLLTALGHAHGRGVLHRDVKPSNVIVGTDRDDGVVSATLIDFGLARSQRLDPSIREQTVGTARYMSPEQAGLLHHDVDERSDLYSLGVLLFECLAGRPPFTGASVGEVLRQHMTTTPAELRTVRPDVPRVLDDVVQRLLRKDPRDRYRSAAGVLADVEELSRQLAQGVREPVLSIGANDRRTTLTESAFVGRERELRALAGEVAAAGRGEGRLAVVEAESGGGKSRLLDEFAQRCVQTGVTVLRGQGVDQAAQRPFEVLRGVAHDLLAAASDDEALRTAVVDGVRDVEAAVRDALPDLEPLFDGTAVPTLGPEEHGEARSVNSLATLLDSLGAPGRPAVVVLDDGQWADELTLSLLHLWVRRRADGQPSYTTVVVAFRSEEVPPDHTLRRLRGKQVRLPPFGAADVRSLVESMAGPLPDAALGVVTHLASGSPFMASAVLRGLVESGALVDTERGWQVEPEGLRQAQSSREAAVFLARRLDLLPDEYLRLLCAAAVLGKEFDLALAAALVGHPAHRAIAAVDEARRRHIVWTDRDGTHGAFVHDKLREAMLDKLAPGDRRALHRAAARLIEDEDPSRVFDLAYHFHSAGDAAAALPYALAAGAQARAQHALQVAEQQYRIAESAQADVETRRRICEGLGDVLMLRGRYDEAARQLTTALSLHTEPADRARLSARLGELAFKQGAVQESIDRLEGALRDVGRRVPRSAAGFLVAALWEVLVQVVHSLAPPAWVQRRSVEGADVEMFAARVYSRLAYSYWFGKGKVPCGWAHLREMNLLERYPPTAELAQAYSEHAPVATTLPWFSRGIAYVERSLRIRTDLGDVWGQGQSLHFYGVVLYAAGRFDEAITKLTSAIRLLERTGDQWEINTAAWHIAFCHYRLGNLDKAAALAQDVYRTGTEIGDHAATAISLGGWSKATGGLVPADRFAAELGRATDDVHSTAEMQTGEAIRLLAAGDPDAAVRLLTDTQQAVRKAGLHMEYVAPVLPWLATALRARADALPAHLDRERRATLRTAAKAARRGHRMASSYRNNLPHALRERALIAALRGRRRAALRWLERSVETAAALGMRQEEIDSRTAMVRLGADLGWPALDVHRAALDELRQAGARTVPETDAALPTLSLADRFDAVLLAGRRITSALTPEAVYAEVDAAALALLRAENCYVVPVDESGAPVVDSSSSTSGDLIRRALEAGRPVALGHAAGDPSDSMVFGGLRSALAAPIFVRGRAVACFAVTHGQLSRLFAEDELRLAGFVATIAGAALENAEGFAEVQELSHSLERRVVERTAEVREAMSRLEDANAELRALDEMKSDFVAMVSHELKTPLTSILGYASTMLRYWDNIPEPDRLDYLRIIDRQSMRLSRLVSDLLEMSRIEAGRLDPNFVALDVRAAVGMVVASYGDGLDVVVDVPPDLCARADQDHVQQILTNYVDNARKYGATPITITARADGPDVVISVSDVGAGVAPDFAARLFDKFAQASTGSRREGSGTGLGLSIVRGLARAGGGDAWYEPNQPAGSRFCVRLPSIGTRP